MLRHGQTETTGVFKGKSDVRLSEDGRKTMQVVSQFLEDENFLPDLIVSSTIFRAIESVALLNRIAAPQYAMPAFDELDVGRLEGTAAALDLDTYNAHAKENAAETSDEAIARVLEGIEMIGQLPGQEALVLSHSILMTILYTVLEKREDLPDLIPVYNGCGYWIDLDGCPAITGLFPASLAEELHS